MFDMAHEISMEIGILKNLLKSFLNHLNHAEPLRWMLRKIHGEEGLSMINDG